MNTVKTKLSTVRLLPGLLAPLLGGIGGGLCLPSSGFAVTNVVRIGNFFFNPTNITINVGDTVTWSNSVLVLHDSTRQALWSSGGLGQGQRFSFTFTNTGSYPYFCGIHIISHPEQTGTVSVITAPNNPPSAVALLNPTFGGGTFTFSFATQTGYTYGAQFTPSLSSISWFTFTNLVGDGSVVQVTDSTLTNGQRFYRVVAQ